MSTTATLDTTVCHICRINPGKYSCPGCLRRSCSVACVQLHKIRSRCTGKRDPTAPVPLSWLNSFSGCEHDHRFLLTKSHELSNRNRWLVQDGLFDEEELQGESCLVDFRDFDRTMAQRTQKAIVQRCNALGISIARVPKGMLRQRQNTTSFVRSSKYGRCIKWQVEWVLHGVDQHPALEGKALDVDNHTTFFKIFDSQPLYQALESCIKYLMTAHSKTQDESESDRCSGGTATAKPRNSKRKHRGRKGNTTTSNHTANRAEIAVNYCGQLWGTSQWSLCSALLQDPAGTWWNAAYGSHLQCLYHFYRLDQSSRPVGSKPRLERLEPTDTLASALPGRHIIEFPTIHVFPSKNEEYMANFEIFVGQRIHSVSTCRDELRKQHKLSSYHPKFGSRKIKAIETKYDDDADTTSSCPSSLFENESDTDNDDAGRTPCSPPESSTSSMHRQYRGQQGFREQDRGGVNVPHHVRGGKKSRPGQRDNLESGKSISEAGRGAFGRGRGLHSVRSGQGGRRQYPENGGRGRQVSNLHINTTVVDSRHRTQEDIEQPTSQDICLGKKTSGVFGPHPQLVHKRPRDLHDDTATGQPLTKTPRTLVSYDSDSD